MTNKTEALKLALEAFEADASNENFLVLKHCVREALADSALDRMAENARELGLDYEPPCKTGSQCTSKCQQCEHPAQQPHCDDCGGFDPECPLAQPAKPSKPWVGLSTDEMKEIADRYHLKPPNVPVAFRAIEAKLKELNT